LAAVVAAVLYGGQAAGQTTPPPTRIRLSGELPPSEPPEADAPVVATDTPNAEPRPTPAGKPTLRAPATPIGKSTPTEPDAMSDDGQRPDPVPEKPAVPEAPPKDADSKPQSGEEPLVPVADTQEGAPVEIEAASFNGVTPGVTTAAEVEKAWGAPKEINKQDGALMQLFSVEPFDRVEVSYFENKVASVIIRFQKAFPADGVAKQLDLAQVRPVLVSNELGHILGQAYPERGVLFAFESGADLKKPSMKVSHIILEPISAEPFVLRAETHLDTNARLSQSDLERALKIQPNNARALWLYARVLSIAGDYDKALTASADAVRLEPNNSRYQVTRAQVLGQAGKLNEAVQAAQKAVDVSKKWPHVQARAQCLLGDLIASGDKPDYKQAIRHHLEAVKLAEPLVKDRQPAVRLAAKEVLVDAHLGAAHDIAWGDWKEKQVAVDRWLGRAAAHADDLIKTEGSSEEQRFRVSTRALAACVGLRGAMDPADWTERTVTAGDTLIGATRDPLRKAQYQWDLGMALYDSLQICQMRNEHDAALRHGEKAIAYLEQGDQQKQSSTSAYLLGRLYFRLGAIHAIRDQNHKSAVTWFEKAVPLLDRELPRDAQADLGRHGETFVSMGVSFWETGRRERAIELTQQGVTLMEQSVKQGLLNESALAIPYGNLSAMHRQMGAKDDANRYQGMASRIKRNKA
jgi:tetratricopeptide (TPR) repeat protein